MQFRSSVMQNGTAEVVFPRSVASEVGIKRESRGAVTTITNLTAEVRGWRRNQDRPNFLWRRIGEAFWLIFICLFGFQTESHAQQLRDAYRSVQQAVVVIRTEQKGLAPYPQQGLVSMNGLGSGVLIFQ
jgi:hypothetical protein